MMNALRGWTPTLRGLSGLGIGGALLWLVLRHVSTDDVASLVHHIQFIWIVLAIALYWADLALRTARWAALLQSLRIGSCPAAEQYSRLGEVLVVGYAVNNVLPARLGELFRAKYAGQRLELRPPAVFGTIIIERLLDGIIVALGLSAGLGVLFTIDGAVAAGYRGPLTTIACCGAGAVGAAVVAVLAVTQYSHLVDRLPVFLRRMSGDLLRGLRCFRQVGIGRISALTVLIWLLEGAAIWALVRSAGLILGWWQTVVLVSALSLGTLVPTAPAYIGSYQLIFALCLASFGLPAAAGVLGATMVQVFLLAPVTIVGLLIFFAIHVSAPMRVANG